MSRDQPLRGRPYPADKLHPAHYLSEFLGTAALVICGLSVVILMFGAGSPVAGLIPDQGLRRAVTGFLFGSTGMLIALSRVGKISGAHINPAMTFAFWLDGKLAWRDAGLYALAQLAGGAAGAVILLVWGPMGASVHFGATLPDPALPVWAALGGEIVCTYIMVTLVFVLAAHDVTQPYVPLINPPLFAVLVWLEAPLSGTSVNPARSLGPALVGGVMAQQWIYVAGPCLGAALAVAVLRLAKLDAHRPKEAKLAHFTAS